MRTHIPLMAAVMLAALTAAATGASPPAQTAGREVRLLTIGNSFSKNATHFLPDIVSAAGHRLIHTPIIVGGASLELHAEKARAHESDPSDERGLYANGKSLKQELQKERWDFVTIQQASLKSHDVATFRPFASRLCDYIKRHAPQAEILLHETWPYRCDDPRFTGASRKADEPATEEAMYRALSAAYGAIAQELKLRQIPVGDAFFMADSDPQWGFRSDAAFSFKGAKYPALPDQTHSLHVGWQWKTLKDGARVLRMDGHHANIAGEYLGACVWFEVLFGESVVGNAFIPKGLDPGYARFLQETAHRAATRSQVAVPSGTQEIRNEPNSLVAAL